MKKRVSILLVFFLFVSLFSWIQPVRALDPANVTPLPHTGGKAAQYTIVFTLGAGAAYAIPATGYFKITFPSDTKLPTSISKTNITVNATALNVDPTISSQTVKLMAPTTYAGGSVITIVFALAAGIKNPMSPTGMVRLKVETGYMVGSTETKIEGPVDSDKYFIGYPATITPTPNTDTPAYGVEYIEYKIEWKTGNEGALTKNSDTITIVFPAGYSIPTWEGLGYIPGNYILVNGTKATSNAVCSGAPLTITVKTPVDVSNSTAVTIILTTQIGLKNPIAGDYFLQLSSTKETTATNSLDYTIYNAVSFLDLLTPTPAGVQGVIVTPPSVSSEAEYKVGLEIDIPLTASLGTISITFPSGTTLPSTIAMTDITFTLNAIPYALTLNPTKSSNTIVITVPVDVNATDDVVITFASTMKIKNPSTAGNYSIQALTSAQPYYRVSPPYAIGTAVSTLKITPSPNAKDATNVRYDIEFKLGSNGSLTANTDKIIIYLEVAAPVPPTTLSASSVLIGTDYTTVTTDVQAVTPADGVPLTYTKFIVSPPKDITSNSTVKVSFLPAAGLKNPATPSNYTGYVMTSKEPILVESPYYSITDTVDIPTAPVVEPPATGVEAKYTFDIVIGQPLNVNEGTISVAFPTGTTVPTSITPGNITINATPLTFPVTVSGGIVTMTVPASYIAGTTLTIVFNLACKIKNPTNVGVYSLQVKTSSQPNYRVSPVYAIGTSVTSVKVTPIPDTKSSINVQYIIEFKLGSNGALTANADTIDIFLSIAAPLPPAVVQPASVTVNGNFCISNITVSNVVPGEPIGTFKLTVTVPKDIAASQTVKVVFLSSAGLQNPTDGNYKGYVRTSKEPIIMESSLYLITNAVSITSVTVTPPSTSVEAKYDILMQIGQSLIKDIDEITVTFPTGTTVPTTITPGSITINGNALLFAPKVSGTSVTMLVPVSIPAPAAVTIVFTISAKIKNPSTAGIYTLQIKTSTQPYYRVSPSYAIGTAVSAVKVTPSPNTKWTNNVNYTVEFKLGSNGALTANIDKIYIMMLVTHIPAPPTTLPAASVMVGSDYTIVATTVDLIAPVDPTDPDLAGYYRFTIIPPKAITSNSTVKVTFLPSAGLQNPVDGNYKAYLRTSQEPIRVDSEYYLITDALDIISVNVNPPSTGTVAEYTIVFQLGTMLMQDVGTITVVFPTGTTVPTLIPVTAITVDAGTPTILKVNPKVSGTRIDITTPINLPIAVPITLTFKTAAGIKNPTTANMYKLQMMTSAQPYFRESAPYAIGSSVTNVKIVPMPNNIFAQNVEYKVTFKVGAIKLIRNTDKIIVYLPATTPLVSISAAAITVNGAFTELTSTIVPGVMLEANLYTELTVITPVDINANSEVTVVFLSACALQNPFLEGIYYGYVATSQENIPMKSELFNIMDTVAFPGVNPPLDFRSVIVKPNAIKLQAQYMIHFRNSPIKPALQANVGTITVAFPEGTKVPGSISSGSIYIYTAPPSMPIFAPDGITCPPGAGWNILSQPVYVSGQEVRIITPVNINPASDIYILFCLSANIQNPSEAGLYTLQVKTSSQPTYGVSRSYLIRSTVEQPTVIPVPAVTNQLAEYTVKFKTGSQGELYANTDKIFIALNGNPGRYTTPLGPIAASAIKINGVYMNIQAVVNTGAFLPANVDNSPSWGNFRWIEMQVPQNIAAGSEVILFFTLTAGITNPAIADNYTAAVWTNKEPVAIESYIYTIGDAILNVTVPPAYPNPKTSGTIAEYYITFTTGASPASLLSPALSSTITITFPEGTKLPSTVNPADIKIGIGGSCPTPTDSALPPVAIDGQSIRFAVPIIINPSSTVCVKILQGVQITNPSTPGSYRLQVMTSSQPIQAYSNYYTILSTSSIPKVTATPPAINHLNTDYLVEFTTGASGSLLNNVGKILIFFDPSYIGDYTLGFAANPSPYPALLTSIPPNSIFVNDVVVNSITKVVNVGPSLAYIEIITPVDITSSTAVKVRLTNLVGIKNPPLVGLYRLVVMTSSEPTPVESQNFSLFSSITAPNVALSVSNNTRPNPNGNTPMANAQYDISFTTGPSGNLVADYGTIKIKFPEDTTIPTYISPGSIRVFNGIITSTLKYAPQIDVANRTITMIVPDNIAASANVIVTLTELANLKNPSQPGSYNLWVSTSAEPLEVKSNPYVIEGVSGAKVSLNPCLFDSSFVHYTFEFVITKALAAGNYIYIEFPYGTKLASVISGSHVLVNGKPANTGTFPQIVVDKQQVQIRIPEALPALTQVKVEFLPDARVTNPGIGTYVAKVRTDLDTNPADLDNDPDNRWVETLPYYVCSNVVLSSLEITPSSITLAKGETRNFTVVAKDENGNEIQSGLTYLWTVGGSIGSVSPMNAKQVTFTAGQNAGSGTLKVDVTYSGKTINATADISISAGLSSISISPSTSTLGLNQTQIFIATALDELGNPMNLDFEWSVIGSIGSITPLTGKQTTLTATTVGTGSVKAKTTFNAVTKEASASVTVSSTPPPPPPPDEGTQVVTGSITPVSVRANQGDVALQITISALTDISTGGVVEVTVPEGFPTPTRSVGAQGFVDAVAKAPANITTPPTVNGRVISVTVQKMLKGNTFTISYSKVSAPSTPGEYLFPLRAKATATGNFVNATDSPKILVISIADGSGRAAITPNEASAGAEGQKFLITYTADAVMDGGAVSISVPDGFSKPSLVTTVQGFVQLQEQNANIGAIEVFDNTITIPIIKLAVNQKITLIYSNVRVPNVENTYTFLVKSKGLGGELKNIALNPTVIVRTSRADTVKVEVNPNMTSVNAEYIITFKTSKTGFIAKDIGSITIIFPPETGIPNTIKSELITVNGNPLKTPPEVDSIRSTVKFVSPVDLDPAVLVQVKFALDTGITNPKTAKEDYKVRLFTSTDTLPADSATYRIIVSSLRNVSVTVSPIVPGASAQYKVKAKVGGAGALNVNQDSITLIFPADTTLPSSIAANLVTVNGTALQMRPTIDISQRKMTVLLPVKIENDNEFTISVASEGNIKNPSRDGMYKLKVFTSKEINPVESEPYQIGQSLLGDVKVSLSTSLVESTNVTYTISFRTGAYGALVVGETVSVSFDRRYILPSIQAYQVSVNGVVCTVTPEIREGHVIIINTPIGISSESTATLTITGITNPKEAGEYNLSLSTKAEPNPVMSTPYRIGLVLETEIAVNPTEPNGIGGWYTIAPNIVLSNSIPSARIFYAWDDGPFMPYTGSSITAPEGVHTFYCYSTAAGLEDEPKKSLLTKVDTKAPVIQLTTPTEGSSFFVPDITVEGNVDEANDFTVTVNGKPATVTNKRFTISITLNPGDNWLDIVATDSAGNRSITPRIRVTYAQPSEIKITVTSPKALTSVYPVLKATTGGSSQLTAVLRVTGKIEPPNATEISIYILGKMQNPVKLPIATDGTFDGNVEVPLVSGLNGITFTVKDKTTGKEYQTSVAVIAKVTLKLQIGNALAFLNDKEYRLDAPPYIKNARTMVPMRFIGESLGASVSWVAETKSVIYVMDTIQIQLTIGSTNAVLVQGDKKQTIKLEAAPEIVNSRTFIPLRFVSENLGAEVQWDAATKKITVLK